ncbi:hypothetical protein TRFO_30479 [Tritrichomonas foetus]|uniref:Uncharacterized protein n=1 Tax=Tritrichomonas foetus TaxID=1144522 RepID=A0A1J4JTG5_9EUKA|nr:hypothetical protein TRFO_30479 [Tritrichomonas foetus]|eukprot:OHT02417.1 hypothetical protein TRFO_30479 [Tritrichomonas foetus]
MENLPQQEDSSSQHSNTGVIDIVIYSKSNNMPTTHMFLGSKMQKVPLINLRHFWIFEIDSLTPDITSLELHISSENGPTTLHTVCFTENQPFAFVDTLPDNEMIPFNDFLLFFNTAMDNKSLSFNFEKDNSIHAIEQFINSFDDKYFLWALLYISAQPWFELFKYNEEMNQLLLSMIPQYITQHFYEQQPEEFQYDVKDYYSNFDVSPEFNNFCYNNNSSANNMPNDLSHYISADPYIDTLFQFLRVQIGDGFVYLLSLFFDFDKDFPFTSYIPPLRKYTCSNQVNDLLSSIILSYSTFDGEELIQIYEKLYYCVLMTATPDFTLDMKPVLDVLDAQLNMRTIAKIINDRMILTKDQSVESLKFIINCVPHFEHVLKVFKSDETFIPLEWIKTLGEVTNIGDPTELIVNSLRNSVPAHYKNHFARVTEHGALIQDDDFDDNEVILQPGAIVQTGAKLGKHSMMMSGSIAPAESELEENSYARRNGIIPRNEHVVAETAIFQHPIILKRGVTIADQAVICQNCQVGSGTQVKSHAIVGPGAIIGSGCIISEGEKVPASTILPAGFRYSRDIVEFEHKVPEIIQRYSIMFLKRYTGFADLETVLSFEIPNKSPVLTEYFHCLSDYPCEAGRQFAKNRVKLEFLDEPTAELITNQMYQIYGTNSLLFAGTYWKEINSNSETAHQSQTETQLENQSEAKLESEQKCITDDMVLALCSHAISQFHLNIDDFCYENVIDALKQIADSLDIMSQKGVSDENIILLKQILFDRCDGVLVRLNLAGHPTNSRLYTTVQSIVDQTKIESHQ